ncbi:voltage-dependent calcium channel subunit alpha-2/delta-3-like isoform X2 [Xenia sp. Carnegie-2017]|uniref:voltage-dependent calcium channel subunit alpha-2/delta-3-like isoform X2 n=1 Tax=Xenia sp. Carnegie-2017 TaxID=2897299 RepID=UPI001F036F55|nr:voltage-dependent calcium channel subunit alpha-2/delta-3-like isoform X2 [Xenia sp. Carnegie-2017]
MNLCRFVLILFSTLLTDLIGVRPHLETGNIAKEIGQDLNKDFDDSTRYTDLTKALTKTNVEQEKRNTSVITTDIKQLIERFNKRLSIAKEIAKFAEDVYANHKEDNDLKNKKFDYPNAKDIDDSNLTTVEGFKTVRVLTNNSTVQTPLDVYQYTNPILNSIKWTGKLDEKFRSYLNSSDIRSWQFIGLSDGVLRIFPGIKWPGGENAKTSLLYYDVRQRSWYIEGSSPPKDMVILLDMSGSVTGNRLLIIKSAVMKLLDTLQENDFVNIIYFNKGASYLIEKKCWNEGLVQATERNKKMLKNAIETLSAKDIAEVKKGFRLAFEALQKARNSNKNKTSNCSQIIAFFTDGVEGDTVAEDVFDKNNREKKIRVFTYLVGRDKGSPSKAVRWIACKNKGFFYRIETLSDVRQTIVKYVSVLSRSRNHKPAWTPVYVDALGLGLLTSVVVPIFDNTTKKHLGVIGSDFTLEEILSFFPEHHLGAGGYAFSITNNGLVFFHPFLKKEEGQVLKQPPDVFLRELLHHFKDESKTEQITMEMILGQTRDLNVHEFKEFRVLAKYNQFRVVKRNLSYSYRRLENTPFSVGIALTDYGSNVIKYSNNASNVKFDTLENNGIKVSVPQKWFNCTEVSFEYKNSSELKQCLKDIPEAKLAHLVHHDVVHLNGWKPRKSSISTFFGSISGVTYSNTMETFDGSSIKQEYFERAADTWMSPRLIFSYRKNEVTISKAVVGKASDNEKVLWGVAGMKVTSSSLDNLVNKRCEEADGDYQCYLLDENGFVVASSNNETADDCKGQIKGEIMNDLINFHVYEKYNFTDVQALCTKSESTPSGSVRLLDPLFSLVNYAKWWIQTVALSMIQYSLYSIFTYQNQVKAVNNQERTSCFKNIPLYYRDAAQEIKGDGIGGNGRVRNYTWSSVGNTNLLLLIVNGSKICLGSKAASNINNYAMSCEDLDSFRVAGENFGRCTPEENESTVCSSGRFTMPSVPLLVSSQVVLLIMYIGKCFR